MKDNRRFRAHAPSNIALIKYWGKANAAQQIPANDSLSMTLSKARTTTTANLAAGENQDSLVWNEQPVDRETPTYQKTIAHLNRLRDVWGKNDLLKIETKNSFPAACGIASSASGFAALTMAASAALTGSTDLNELVARAGSLQKLANWSRLGSGSSIRSFHPGFTHWRAIADPVEQPISQVPSELKLSDIIVLVDPQPKKISSSEGHSRVHSSPLYQPRLAQIPKRVKKMRQALLNSDFTLLGEIAEQDALDMHAVALSTTPATPYFGERTSEILSWLIGGRSRGEFEAYFTLDAGPNVHILVEPQQQELMAAKINQHFPQYELLIDETGSGPELEVEVD